MTLSVLLLLKSTEQLPLSASISSAEWDGLTPCVSLHKVKFPSVYQFTHFLEDAVFKNIKTNHQMVLPIPFL